MGRLSQVLNLHDTIALDSSCFIYFFEKKEKYEILLEEVFSMIENGFVSGVTSVLALTEVLVKPIQEGNNLLQNRYRMLMKNFPNLSMINVEPPIAQLAAKLRAKYRLRTPDAIFLATAIREGAGVFLTNDRNLTKVEEVSVIYLKDYLEDIKE
ncbi:MAG: type II toxin-antitoxin system VapC family toxin [Thermincolia bacterium]